MPDKFYMVLYKQPGVGTPVTLDTYNQLQNTMLACITSNTPFQVGHTFGNIDGSHPKRG